MYHYSLQQTPKQNQKKWEQTNLQNKQYTWQHMMVCDVFELEMISKTVN